MERADADRVFVNARPRSVIMEDMERRIERGDYEAEKVEGINVSHGQCSGMRRMERLMESRRCVILRLIGRGSWRLWTLLLLRRICRGMKRIPVEYQGGCATRGKECSKVHCDND